MRSFDLLIFFGQSSGEGHSLFNIIGALIFIFGPWFFIKQIVQSTGQVGGFLVGAGDKVSKAMDPTQNLRKNKKKQRAEKMGEGKLYQGGNRISKKFNDITEGIGVLANAERKSDFFNKEGRDAMFTQRRTERAAKHAGSDRAKASQHNDPMLRALTFENEADARANFKSRFAKKDEFGNVTDVPTDEDVEIAVKAARANGGWTADRQIYAAKQLAATGTGYDSVEQAYNTAAAASRGNRGSMADIAGALKANPQRVDMNASFGTHMKMVEKAFNNNGLRPEDIDFSTMEALDNTDAISMARAKPTAVKLVTAVAAREIEKQNIIATDASRSAADRNAAQKRAGQLAGIVEQAQNAAAYASPINIEHTSERLIQPTEPVRNEIKERTVKTVVLTDSQGRKIELPNSRFSAHAQQGYAQQSPAAGRRQVDVNDPNFNP